jgi:hypothetical protein
MKRRLIQLLFGILLPAITTLFLFSCKKDDNPAPAVNTFSWMINGTNYTADLDSGYEASAGFNPFTIIAITGTNFNTNFSRKIQFTLNSFTPGTFTIGSGGNILYYVNEAGQDFFGTGGSLTLSSYSNRKLSGSFNCTMAGPGGNTTITGNFVNVPVRPF